MDDEFSLQNNNPGPGAGAGPVVDRQQLARLVLAAQAARQVGQSTGVSPTNGPGSGVGDPQQLAQLVMAARALQHGGQPAGAAGQTPMQAPAATVLAPTNPFATAVYRFGAAGPQAST